MAPAVTQATEQRFAGQAAQVPQARAWTLSRVPGGHARRDDIALAVTELATNAVIHSVSGAGGSFTVRIEVTEAFIELTVTDQGPALVPARREPEESGRGLVLVDRVADACDVTEASGGGRAVRCRFTTPQGGRRG